MIETFLVDDEKNNLSSLSNLLQEFCPQIVIKGQFTSSVKALQAILEQPPHLIFLDIEMPEMSGFELLDRIKNLPVSVIFTTAFQQYAIKAIKYSALDYLMKPIDYKELISAVDKYSTQLQKVNFDQFQFLIDKMAQKESTIKKLAIHNMEGFRLINYDEIIYCEADGNYTHIYLKGKQKITATRVLRELQELLDDFGGFVRIHHSFLINYREVVQYIKGEGGQVIMTDGTEVTVSRNKKEILLKYLGK